MANIVSVALFGDGVAATVLVGERFPGRGNGGKQSPAGVGSGAKYLDNGNGLNGARSLPARIVATESTLFPNTEDMMGFDLTDGGLKIFLRAKVPRFLREAVFDLQPVVLKRLVGDQVPPRRT